MSEALAEGTKLFESGLYESALIYLKDLDPVEEPEAAYYQALTYSKLGRSPEALYALDLVIAQESNFLKLLQARMIRAFILTQNKRYDEAEKSLRELVDEGVESSQVFSNYGYVLWAKGQVKEGIAWLNRALKNDPDNPNVLNSLAFLLAEEGVLLDKALQLCRKALTLKKDNPAYLDTLGWIYHRMGQSKIALFHLEKALAAHPENPHYQGHLAEARKSLGERTPSPGGLRP